MDLYDPDTYVGGPPHAIFDELRASQPVCWQAMPDEPGYWMVLRHDDVVEVARNPEVFSASEGGVVVEDLPPERLEQMRKMLLAMDPPQHTAYRRVVSPEFRARVIGRLEDRLRSICQRIMASIPRDTEIDFVHDVAAKLPSQVIGEIMGLPREDWSKIHDWAERQTSGTDPDINPESYDRATPNDASAPNPSVEMAMYAIEFATKRRASGHQPEDLTTVILDADFGGGPMTEIDFGSFFVQLVTAGNDTTKTMLSSGLAALLQHPDQLEELRHHGDLTAGAVEEILRWANPLHYFRRTATRDYELRGVTIRAGDKVAMMYTSANRDPEVFDDPHRFDIHRDPNPHLSFGIAQHFCLGVHLARLEGRVFFEELLATFPLIELCGEPRRTRSNLNNAIKYLPVKLSDSP